MLAWALSLLVSPVGHAAGSVTATSTAAIGDYTADGRLPLDAIMGRFDELSTQHGWLPEIIYSYPDAQGVAIKFWRTPHRGDSHVRHPPRPA